ncbi:coiled-coil domain-containing protein 174-like [Clavelina lepadiformis]|uniref:coiled-coil domain-containing protein 174-like n=1 Tax=Clavelina lepadiformis TaxID=159417 RepID=UPI00404192DD
MLNLKSELLKKEQEFKQQKSGVDDKKGLRKPLSWMKKQSEKKVKVKEEKKRPTDLTDIENEKYNKVQAILEAKSKMYNKMTSGDIIPDSEESEMFLVDFEQKSIEAWREKREKGESINPDVNVKTNAKQFVKDAKDEWVEYIDSLGRTRTCLKTDLPRLERIDEKLSGDQPKQRTLMSDDMRREEERLKWEDEVLNEQEEVHYENLRFRENRELGVGYFAFSGKTEEREEQLKRLDQLRMETEKQKQANEAKKEKEKKMLATRLEKVRQKRVKQLQKQGKEVPSSLLQPIEVEPEKEKEVVVKEVAKSDDEEVKTSAGSNASKMRDWDAGKEWQPAQPMKVPKSWKDPHDERLDEFAPPSFYFNGSGPKRSKKDASYNSSEDPDLPPKQQQIEIPPNISTSSKSLTNNERIDDLISTIRRTTSDQPAIDKKISADKTIQSSSKKSEEELQPFVPSSKPITMKLKPKPSTILQTNSILNE